MTAEFWAEVCHTLGCVLIGASVLSLYVGMAGTDAFLDRWVWRIGVFSVVAFLLGVVLLLAGQFMESFR